MPFTPRERVLSAVDHQEPDRVPFALWGSWYGLTDAVYFKALETLGWQPVPPFRPKRFHSVNYYDDRLLHALHVDVRHVDPGSVAACCGAHVDAVDAFGITWKTLGPYRSPAGHPLRAATVDVVAQHPLPAAEALIDATGIRERLRTIGAMDTEYAIIGRAVASYGLFEMAQALRGPEQFLMDLAIDPELAHTLINRLCQCYAGLIDRFLEVVGEDVDLLELPGDDFAGNTGPIISPAMFDRFFKEPYRQLIALIKVRCPHMRVIWHSDGMMTHLLPRLVEIGADVFHSVEPLPGWNLSEVKAQWGSRLAFMGGIDVRHALRGDDTSVEVEVTTRLRELGPGGGYILAPANHVQSDVPPANLFALSEAVRRLGAYPLTA
jgi:uroporphyrinogen decarboxylase